MADGITTVDNRIELRPVAHGIGLQQVLFQNLVNLVGNIRAHHHVVGAQLAPDTHSRLHITVLQGFVAAVDNAVDVSLLSPEIFEHHVIHRQDVEEVVAAGCQYRSAAAQHTSKDILFDAFGIHNFYLLSMN